MKSIREWLKAAREEKNKTMKMIAMETGISECYYCQIENGDRNASVEVAKKIATALGFKWERFFE